MLSELGEEELLIEYKREQSLKRKEWHDKKQMERAVDTTFATSAGEELRKKKKKRKLKCHEKAKVAGSSAVHQQKQATNEASV